MTHNLGRPLNLSCTCLLESRSKRGSKNVRPGKVPLAHLYLNNAPAVSPIKRNNSLVLTLLAAKVSLARVEAHVLVAGHERFHQLGGHGLVHFALVPINMDLWSEGPARGGGSPES